MKPAIVVATAVLVATIWPARDGLAKTGKQFRLAGWSGGAVVNEQTKRFAHCSASLSNPTGTSISYALNGQYGWALSFSNPAWRFSPGFSLTAALRIDGRLIPNQRAVFTS